MQKTQYARLQNLPLRETFLKVLRQFQAWQQRKDAQLSDWKDNQNDMPLPKGEQYGLIAAALVASAMLLLFAFGGEAFFYIQRFVCFWLTAAVLTAIALALLSLAGWHFKEDVRAFVAQNLSKDALSSGQKRLEIGIGGDIPILSGAQNDFAERFAQARETAKAGQWIVAIRFQDPLACIVTGQGETIGFNRFSPPWQSAKNGLGVIDPEGKFYANETWQDYERYVSEFFTCYREWVGGEKFQRSNGNVMAYETTLRSFVTLALMVVTFTCYAQSKTQRLQNYLGDKMGNVAEKGLVKFRFDKTEITRESDGTKTYAKLLSDDGYFTDSDAGNLKAVLLVQGSNTSLISEGRRVVNADTKPISALPVAPSPGLDSLGMEQKADEAIETFEGWKAQAWKAVKPGWRVVMYVFSSILTFLFFFGAFLRYVAKTASGESAINLHGTPIVGGWIVRAQQSAAGALLLICWIVTGFTMLNLFMWIVWLDWSLWMLLVFWFPVQWLAEILTNWLVPDIKVVARGRQEAAELARLMSGR